MAASPAAIRLPLVVRLNMGKGPKGPGKPWTGLGRAADDRLRLDLRELPAVDPVSTDTLEDSHRAYLEVVVRRWIEKKSLDGKR